MKNDCLHESSGPFNEVFPGMSDLPAQEQAQCSTPNMFSLPRCQIGERATKRPSGIKVLNF